MLQQLFSLSTETLYSIGHRYCFSVDKGGSLQQTLLYFLAKEITKFFFSCYASGNFTRRRKEFFTPLMLNNHLRLVPQKICGPALLESLKSYTFSPSSLLQSHDSQARTNVHYSIQRVPFSDCMFVTGNPHYTTLDLMFVHLTNTNKHSLDAPFTSCVGELSIGRSLFRKFVLRLCIIAHLNRCTGWFWMKNKTIDVVTVRDVRFVYRIIRGCGKDIVMRMVVLCQPQADNRMKWSCETVSSFYV